jgi:hypothetical protein
MKSNPYDPEYVMQRDNCEYDQAVDTIRKFKENKATNLKNFIKKYGESEGTARYNDWKSKSLGIGHQQSRINGAAQSRLSPEFYLKRGHTEDEAKRLATDYQHSFSPLHIEYYIKKGKTLEFARKKIREIHDKKLGIDGYKEYLKRTTTLSESEISEILTKSRSNCSRKYLTEEEFAKRISKMRKTFEDCGLWIPLENLSNYENYKRKVWHHTLKHDISALANYEKRGRAGTEGAYQLDHKFSISRGFIEGVDPELIGSLKNLEFIPWEDNIKKQGNCSIQLEELINKNDEN